MSALRELDRDLPVSPIRLSERIRHSIWGPRTAAALLGTLGVLAVALAALGLYAVLAFNVAQRARELGIRAALGATHHDVIRLVGVDAGMLVVAGFALGTAVVLALARFAAGLFHEVRPDDPLLLGGTAGLLALTGLVASILPARRATRVDPAEALRAD
jgi:putative ABC transport system permease protein